MSLDSRGTVYKQDFDSGKWLYGLLDAISKKLPATQVVENDSLLLDVGCACGDIGAAFNKLKNCRCVGFEYNPKSIEIAQSTGAYENLHQVDLDVFNPDDFSQYFGSFDYILLGDVLEHLRKPDEVILKLKKFLKPSGAFLLSFPNIAHASIKAALLHNRFDYAEYGLLDKTHIHFFTYKSIAKFLANANLGIEHAHPLFFDIFDMLDFNPYLSFSYSTKRLILKDIHSHIGEYIILCRLSNDSDLANENFKKLNFKMKDYRRHIRMRSSSGSIFRIVNCKNGRKHIRLFGIKIFSYRRKKKQKLSDVLTIYTHKLNNAGYKISRKKDGIHIEGNGLHIVGSAENTIWTAASVLADREYEFDPCGSEYIVIDIGLNIGMTSLWMAQKEYVKEIYSFEPFMPTMAQARHNMKLNPKLAEKIILFDFGLSDSDKALDISYNPNLPGAMSSIAGKNSGDLTERINLRNASDVLAPIFKKRDKKKIMLKIDCEGGEREILPDLASSGLLQQADVIIMEYHDGYYLPLVKIMEDSGFSVEITEQHDNGTGMIVATK